MTAKQKKKQSSKSFMKALNISDRRMLSNKTININTKNPRITEKYYFIKFYDSGLKVSINTHGIL